MGIFRKAEKKLEGFVEGGFGRAFKSSVQPVELAHKLAKEMGDHKTVGVSNVYVPNEFDVYLGQADYEQLSAFFRTRSRPSSPTTSPRSRGARGGPWSPRRASSCTATTTCASASSASRRAR